jgi:hypothetical protein
MQQILSAATVTAVGLMLTRRAYLHSGICSISVRGLPYLLDALYSSERRNGQDILTSERVVPQQRRRAAAERPLPHTQILQPYLDVRTFHSQVLTNV